MSEQALGELVLAKSITVDAPVDTAFRVYTEEIASWWPLKTHSVLKDKAETIVFEPRAGGRIIERGADDAEHL
jgi:hypothetical protein